MKWLPPPIEGICRVCRCPNYLHDVDPPQHVFRGKNYAKHRYIDTMTREPQWSPSFCRKCNKSCTHIRSTLKIEIIGVEL